MAVPTFVAASSASTNTASNTVTCTYPAGSASGDLLVMFAGFHRATASGSQTLTTPAGWNLLDTQNDSSTTAHTSATYWRFRGAETSVSVVCSNATSQFGSVQIHAYNGDVDPSTPINVTAIQTQTSPTSSAANRLAPSVTTTAVNCAVSIFGVTNTAFSGRTFTWPNATERIDGYSGSAGDIYFTSATSTQPTAGATGTFTITPSGTIDQIHTATIAIQPVQNQTVNDTDDVAVSDDASVAATINETDSGSISAESADISVLDPTGDAASASESAFVTAAISADDAASVSNETASVTAQVFADDSVAAVDDAFASNTVQESDQTSLSEGNAAVEITENDAISASETASVAATISPTDSAALTEDSSVAVSGAVDAASLADVAGITPTVTGDAAALSETASISVVVSASDDAAISEYATVEITTADSISQTDNAVKLISGLLITPRKVSVERDHRRVWIEAESRRIEAVSSFRMAYMRKETQRTIIVGPEKRLVRIETEV